jgi:hypothetical protein
MVVKFLACRDRSLGIVLIELIDTLLLELFYFYYVSPYLSSNIDFPI